MIIDNDCWEIVVTVNEYDYNVCVACENVRSMVRSVIDKVALKL